MEIIVPETLASNQAISVLMNELRKLNTLRTDQYRDIDSPTLRRQITEVEEGLELLINFYDR